MAGGETQSFLLVLEALTKGVGADLELGAMAVSPRGHGGHVTQQTMMEPHARWEKVDKPQNVRDGLLLQDKYL